MSRSQKLLLPTVDPTRLRLRVQFTVFIHAYDSNTFVTRIFISVIFINNNHPRLVFVGHKNANIRFRMIAEY